MPVRVSVGVLVRSTFVRRESAVSRFHILESGNLKNCIASYLAVYVCMYNRSCCHACGEGAFLLRGGFRMDPQRTLDGLVLGTVVWILQPPSLVVNYCGSHRYVSSSAGESEIDNQYQWWLCMGMR